MDWRVDLPEGSKGDVEIRKIEVKNDLTNMMLGARSCVPGTYTALYRRGALWMSDTTAEQYDQWDAVRAMRQYGGRVLIGGLGLGMAVKCALEIESVEHVDVIEIDPDVAALVGQHYEGPRCTVHVADVYEKTWPKGTRWDVAWWDVWQDLCTDNLEEMARLARSYGRRVTWQGFWGKELLQAQRRREQRSGWY